MSGPAHSCTATMPAAAARSRAAQRAPAPLLRVSAGRGRRRAPGDGRRRSAAAARIEALRIGQAGTRAGAARSTPPPSGRRRGPGRPAGRRRRRRGRRCSARCVRASRTRPSRVPRSAVGMGRGRSRRPVCRQCRQRGGRAADPVRRGVSPVAVRWTWLSTNAGATKAPSRSTICASGNWARPTSSLPSQATMPSRTAIAVASGHGRAVHPAVEQKRRHLVGFALHGRPTRLDIGDVDDLAVDVVTAPAAAV